MVKLFSAIFMVIFLAASSAIAAVPVTCAVRWTDMAKRAGSLKIVELTPAQRLAAQTRYNANPPPSHEVFSHIYVIELAPGALGIFFVEDGCVVDGGPITPAQLEQFIAPGPSI